jgi:hypothetical protein
MNTKYFFTSMTRISGLAAAAFAVEPLAREAWNGGDYVVGEVCGPASSLYRFELESGRMIGAAEGDLVVGALGKRAATLEATGDWEAIEADGLMEMLTGAGLFGKCLSKSTLLPPLLTLRYRGHVLQQGRKVTMRGCVEAVPERPFTTPVVLLVGSSMSAGKTTAARVVIRLLKRAGRTVIGAKLTGAGRYRDVLSMGDAGADYIFDFVDAGLPSTVCPEATYRWALRQLLSRMAGAAADVAVVEAGASPLEPYNGAVASAELEENVRLTILCASDPYAVLGVMSAFGIRPDLVTGIATNTEAGIALVERLAGIRALNVLEKKSLPELAALLHDRLGRPSFAA